MSKPWPPDRAWQYELLMRRANLHRYRPRPVVGPPDPVLLAQLLEDLGPEEPPGEALAVLFDPGQVSDELFAQLMRAAAGRLGITIPHDDEQEEVS